MVEKLLNIVSINKKELKISLSKVDKYYYLVLLIERATFNLMVSFIE